MIITVLCGQDFCDTGRPLKVMEPQISNLIALTYPSPTTTSGLRPFFPGSRCPESLPPASGLQAVGCWLLANR